MPLEDQQMCRCGHTHEAHEHLRRGTDCALCAPGDCKKFRLDPVQPVAADGAGGSGVPHSADDPGRDASGGRRSASA